ncbi:galectin-12 isoform X2 [Nycticebus coucang]|uniref:galectin-12 isoform X2 n=1 Tax=Nycticebus coucang TaxID=9470 RepID=UPI00234D462C|nr:galectin-12 isoform X2 [Nycticebus coucang]
MSPGEKLDPIPDRFILQPPVFHPVVPYVTTIFGGLHTGKMVMLQGVVPRDAHKFQVDFQCGCSLYPRPDIAIHFNPRFYTTKPHVICNTLYGGRWQKEARWPHLALQRGSSFLILFLFGNEEVKVSVNGQHFLHYHYRLPLSRVDTLGIFGDIMVKAVGFLNINPFAEGSREYPAGHPFLLRSPKLVSKPPSSLAWRYSSWPAPWAGGLGRGWRAAEGLWPGQIIVVRGLVLQEPKECCSCARREGCSWHSMGRGWGPPASAIRLWSGCETSESVEASSSTVSTTEGDSGQRRGQPASAQGPTKWPLTSLNCFTCHHRSRPGSLLGHKIESAPALGGQQRAGMSWEGLTDCAPPSAFRV